MTSETNPTSIFSNSGLYKPLATGKEEAHDLFSELRHSRKH